MIETEYQLQGFIYRDLMFFRTSTLFDASMIKAMDQKVQDLSHLTQQMLMMFWLWGWRRTVTAPSFPVLSDPALITEPT